jgi:hypothetical protein
MKEKITAGIITAAVVGAAFLSVAHAQNNNDYSNTINDTKSNYEPNSNIWSKNGCRRIWSS